MLINTLPALRSLLELGWSPHLYGGEDNNRIGLQHGLCSQIVRDAEEAREHSLICNTRLGPALPTSTLELGISWQHMMDAYKYQRGPGFHPASVKGKSVIITPKGKRRF